MLMERICEFLTPEAAESELSEATDRRVALRKAVLFRATIYPIDVFCDARIRDVSATGLRGEADVELAVGQTLHITTDERAYHAGIVRWVRDRVFGLDLPNASTLFGDQSNGVEHGDREGQYPRAPRAKMNATARLVAGRPPRPATVRNLSASGMLLDTSPGIKPGQHLVVRVGNSPPIYGRAQWSQDAKVGFRAQHGISILSIVSAVG